MEIGNRYYNRKVWWGERDLIPLYVVWGFVGQAGSMVKNFQAGKELQEFWSNSPILSWREMEGQGFWIHLFSSDKRAIIHLIPGTVHLVFKAINCTSTHEETELQRGEKTGSRAIYDWCWWARFFQMPKSSFLVSPSFFSSLLSSPSSFPLFSLFFFSFLSILLSIPMPSSAWKLAKNWHGWIGSNGGCALCSTHPIEFSLVSELFKTPWTCSNDSGKSDCVWRMHHPVLYLLNLLMLETADCVCVLSLSGDLVLAERISHLVGLCVHICFWVFLPSCYDAILVLWLQKWSPGHGLHFVFLWVIWLPGWRSDLSYHQCVKGWDLGSLGEEGGRTGKENRQRGYCGVFSVPSSPGTLYCFALYHVYLTSACRSRETTGPLAA